MPNRVIATYRSLLFVACSAVGMPYLWAAGTAGQEPAATGAATTAPAVRNSETAVPRAPWLQAARVFLIDAYEPPFEPRLEYDAPSLAETMQQMHANTVRISTMGKYALIPKVRFTPHPELGSRDILAETIAACKRRGIRVVPYVSTGHKLAWTMVTRDYPDYAQRTRPGGGPARSHMFVGEDHGTVCWNTPYRQAFFDLVERLVRDYEIDGIYFDAWTPGYFWPGRGVCYCDGCRNGFRQATGMELPWKEGDSDYTSAELGAIDRYRAWYRDLVAEIAGQIRQLVKSYKDIPLISNIGNPVRMADGDPRIRAAMDAFLYERGNSILERAEGVSLARAAGLGVWPYVGEYNNWPRVVYNGFDFQQQIFTTLMFGGAPILALPWGYVSHAENRHFVEYAFGVVSRHEEQFAGFQNQPYVAVLYDSQTPRGHEQSGWWWKTDARSSSLGAFAASLYGHVQVTSVPAELLNTPDGLRGYQVLYLAGYTRLSEPQLTNVRRFVREGGGLVASYEATLFDEDDRQRPRFALEDLLRVAPAQLSQELSETLASYRSMTGGPYDLYLTDHAAPATAPLTPLWEFLPVTVLEGGEVWQDIVAGDGRRPLLPGVVVSKYGHGRVVYCASALESLFLQQNIGAVGDLLRTLVSRAAAEAPPFGVDAPATLIANLSTNGHAYVLHLANWTGNKFERAGANEYYLAPVRDVVVRLAIPNGKRVRSVRLLVEAPYQQEQRGSTLHVSLPEVGAYQAICVELE
jgi:hypothetical protein